MRYTQLLERLFQVKTTKTNSIKMVFKCHFNAIRFYSKLNRFVLSPRKKNEPLRFKNSSGWFCGLYFTLFSYLYLIFSKNNWNLLKRNL